MLCTYINGQKGTSNHVVATCSFTLTESTFAPSLYCLRHSLTLLPVAFRYANRWAKGFLDPRGVSPGDSDTISPIFAGA